MLQRIEQFNGLVILTSNFKSNIDEAFLRRFNTLVKFNKPNADERLRLWKNMISGDYSPDDALLKQLAYSYELTGAQIVSVIAFATLQAIDKQEKQLSKQFLLAGIKEEFQKMELNFTDKM